MTDGCLGYLAYILSLLPKQILFFWGNYLDLNYFALLLLLHHGVIGYSDRSFFVALMAFVLVFREASHGVEEALKLINCPHPLQASDIYNLEIGSVYPVAQWLVNHVQTRDGDTGDKVSFVNWYDTMLLN